MSDFTTSPVYQTPIPILNEIPTAQGQSIQIAYFSKNHQERGDYDIWQTVPWLYMYQMLVLNDRPPAGQLFQVWTQWETNDPQTPYENYQWAIDYDFSFAGQITEQNLYKS